MKHFPLPFQFIDDEALQGQEEGKYIFSFFFPGGGVGEGHLTSF